MKTSALVSSLTERLFDAIHQRDAEAVRAVLKAGADPNARDSRGERPIFEAAHRGLGLVQMLIAAGANPRVKDKEGHTLLHAGAGDPQLVVWLLEKQFDPNARDENDSTPLLEAASAGNVRSVQLLLDAGATITARDKQGDDVLMRAIQGDNIKVVSELLARGAKWNATDRDSYIFSSWYSGAEMVRFLAAQGFSFNLSDNEGQTPLNSAIVGLFDLPMEDRADDENRVLALIEVGADVNALSQQAEVEEREAPLHVAASIESPTIVRALLQAGADPNRHNGRGNLPLQAIFLSSKSDPELSSEQEELVTQLIAAGTRLDTIPQTGWFREPAVLKLTHDDILPHLKAAIQLRPETNLDVQDPRGQTALMKAMETGQVQTARFLIESGANVHLKDNSGQSALDYFQAPVTQNFGGGMTEWRGNMEQMATRLLDRNGELRDRTPSSLHHAGDDEHDTIFVRKVLQKRREIRQLLHKHGVPPEVSPKPEFEQPKWN